MNNAFQIRSIMAAIMMFLAVSLMGQQPSMDTCYCDKFHWDVTYLPNGLDSKRATFSEMDSTDVLSDKTVYTFKENSYTVTLDEAPESVMASFTTYSEAWWYGMRKKFLFVEAEEEGAKIEWLSGIMQLRNVVPKRDNGRYLLNEFNYFELGKGDAHRFYVSGRVADPDMNFASVSFMARAWITADGDGEKAWEARCLMPFKVTWVWGELPKDEPAEPAETQTTAGEPYDPSLDETTPPVIPGDPDEILLTATSHGRTTMHFGDLLAYNPTEEPILVDVNPSLIPSGDGLTQPYLVISDFAFEVLPGETLPVPVEAICVDVFTPPVEAGERINTDWISIDPDIDPETFSESLTLLDEDAISAKPYLLDPEFATELPGMEHLPGIPAGGTYALNYFEHPELAAPLIYEAYQRIRSTYQKMNANRQVSTPFKDMKSSNTPPPMSDQLKRAIRSGQAVLNPDGPMGRDIYTNMDKQEEAVVQQAFWMFTSTLSCNPYDQPDFTDRLIGQYEDNTGEDFEAAPPEVQDQIQTGSTDFWEDFEAVNVGAKVLRPNPATAN